MSAFLRFTTNSSVQPSPGGSPASTIIRIPKYLLDDVRELVAADPDLELSEVFVMGLERWLLDYLLERKKEHVKKLLALAPLPAGQPVQ